MAFLITSIILQTWVAMGTLLSGKKRIEKSIAPILGFEPGNTWLQDRDASQFATDEPNLKSKRGGALLSQGEILS